MKSIFVRLDSAQARLVEISHRSFCRQLAPPYLLPDAPQDVFPQIVGVILGLPERDRSINLPCGVGSNQKVGNFSDDDLARVHEIDDLAAVHAVPSQSVGVPRQDAGSDALLNLGYHLAEHRAAGFLRALALCIFADYE